MDIFDEELLEFWRVLNANNVLYIMVGGFAVNMQGFLRATKDADLWLKDEVTNRINLRNAFVQLGYGDYPSIETMQFIPGWTQFYIAGGLVMDVMTEMKGLEQFTFDDCYNRAKFANLNDIIVPFLHINDLISNKRAVARPKDQIDVLELEKIKKLTDDNLL